MQQDPFDPATLRLTGDTVANACNAKPKRPPRHGPGGKFLKGPIPWPWLQQAAKLPGKALHVALLLWQKAGYRRDRRVRFCLAHGGQLGMRPDAARRGLRALAKAGLVTIHQSPGRCQEVSLEDVQRDSQTG
jgi:hypothetical protein